MSAPREPKSPIREAFDYALDVKWRRTRNYAAYRGVLAALANFFEGLGVRHLDDIRKPHLLALADAETAKGNSPATIKWKLAALQAVVREAAEMDPKLSTKGLPKITIKSHEAPKWWLRPEDKDRLLVALRHSDDPVGHTVADYIEFITLTGVRVEEALRFTRESFHGLGTGAPIMWVPGTKTRSAANSLPLSQEAAALVSRRLGDHAKTLFEITYRELLKVWTNVCRPIVDPEGNDTATLKSLRRTFGWYATKKGMPTAILQKFYRHSKITTTAGYLNLIGGNDAETLRQWL